MIEQTTIVVIGSLRVKVNGYTFRGGNFVKLFGFISEKGSAIKVKNLPPLAKNAKFLHETRKTDLSA